ncbi:MAG: hypothetical protein M3264_03225 [Thermoproteota archaeon]|nr:hypothetical protein [Thermoproteota archaeon]
MISKDLVSLSFLSVTALMGGVLLIGSLSSAIAQDMGNNETELIMNQTMNNQSDAAIMSNDTAAISNQSEMTNATIATPVNETGNPIVDTLKDMFDR